MGAPPEHVSGREVLRAVSALLSAVAHHRGTSAAVETLAAELEALEAELLAGRASRLRLAVALQLLVELEYTPWRVAAVAQELAVLARVLGIQ